MRRALILCLLHRAAAQQQLSINFGGPPASPAFQGVSAVRHGFDYMQEETSRGLSPALRNLSHARLAASRLTHARTWYASEWAMPLGWGTPLNFTAPRFEQFAAWVADMQRAGVRVVMNAGWWFPQCTCGAGAPANCTPSPASIDVFTAWVSASVRELVVARGLTNLDTLLLFTEPFPTPAGLLPPGVTQEQLYATVVRALHARMVAEGTRGLVKFHGPNDGGLSSPVAMAALQWAALELRDVLDVFSSHDYNLAGYAAWLDLFTRAVAATAPTGKPFWVDEGGHSNEAVRNSSSYGTYVAAWQAAAMNAGAANTFLWLLQDQVYAWPLENTTNNDSFDHGLHRWGLSFWLPDQVEPRPAWYAHDLLTRFLRPPQGAAGVQSFRMGGAVPGAGVVGAAVAGSAAGGGRPDYTAVLLVNEGAAPVRVEVAMAGAGAGRAPLQRYLYDPAAPPHGGAGVAPSGSRPFDGAPLVDTLPPGGVVVWASAWETTGAAA